MTDSLEEATKRLLAAIAAENFPDMEAALDARAEAIRGGAVPTPEIIAAGERAALTLTALKQRLAAESGRLHRLQSGIATLLAPRPSKIDCRG